MSIEMTGVVLTDRHGEFAFQKPVGIGVEVDMPEGANGRFPSLLGYQPLEIFDRIPADDPACPPGAAEICRGPMSWCRERNTPHIKKKSKGTPARITDTLLSLVRVGLALSADHQTIVGTSYYAYAPASADRGRAIEHPRKKWVR